jgi:signal transduction histidine kinase
MNRKRPALFPHGRPEKVRREFYSVLSHLHRTPLSSAGGYLDLIRKGYAGRLNKAQCGYLSQARASLRQLRRVIDAFLDLVAFDLDLIPRQSEATDLAAFLRQAQDEISAAAAGAGRAVDFRLPQGRLAVRVDPKWLQVLSDELLSNAFRLAPRGSRIEIRLDSNRRAALLTVSDRGPGVPAEQLRRLGEPFFQSRGAAAKAPGGERGGMGLALADRIVRMAGGRLRPRLRPRGGLVMTAELPLAPAPAFARAG